jgi:cytochrome oxidase Cu insertion factor (SCO1/SenC/PrrC family)
VKKGEKKMKTFHHFLAVLLAVLLCLSLTACGDSQRGDNYYVHTVNYNGNEYLIDSPTRPTGSTTSAIGRWY